MSRGRLRKELTKKDDLLFANSLRLATLLKCSGRSHRYAELPVSAPPLVEIFFFGVSGSAGKLENINRLGYLGWKREKKEISGSAN